MNDLEVQTAMQDYMHELMRSLTSLVGNRAASVFFDRRLKNASIYLDDTGIFRFTTKDKETINKLFKKFTQEFFTKFISDFGYDMASHMFEKSFIMIRNIHSEKTIEQISVLLPENALLVEKTKLLSNDELQNYVYNRTRELEELNISLEAQVQERTLQLSEANNALQRVNQQLTSLDTTRKEFLSLISHQIRTSLTANKWIVSVFIESPDYKRLSEDSQKNIHSVYRQTELMIRLVENLLNNARIEDGRYSYSFTKVTLDLFLNDIVATMMPFAEASFITLQYILPKEDNLYIKADENKIRLVFENLIDNAIKYSTRDSKVLVTLKRENTAAKICITDTGIGIPVAEQRLLFEKFFRASNTKQRSGSGLGLFLATKIIRDHGGEILFESSPENGSTFCVVIPLVNAGAEIKK